MHVESYSPRHAEQVAALIVKIRSEDFGALTLLNDQPGLRTLGEGHQSKGGVFWVALESSQVVGTIAFLNIGEGGAALSKMFVAKSHRGPKPGVPAKLLETFFFHAQAQKISRIYLGTTGGYTAAHRFYEKNGFVSIPVDQLPKTFPRSSMDTEFYRIDI